MMIKESLIQGDTTFLTYMILTRKHQNMGHKLLEIKGALGKFTITTEDCNSPLSIIDTSSRQKISKDNS